MNHGGRFLNNDIFPSFPRACPELAEGRGQGEEFEFKN